jgi:hypothetical protein
MDYADKTDGSMLHIEVDNDINSSTVKAIDEVCGLQKKKKKPTPDHSFTRPR